MNKKRYRKKLVLKDSIVKFISRTLISIIIILMGLISVKTNPNLKGNIEKNVYNENIKFAKIRELYNKYFGNIIPVEKVFAEEKQVFTETLNYNKANTYKDGVVLKVTNKYMVPALDSGVVVFIGEKDEYGKTIIIDQVDGTEVFYGNINNLDLKLYDYVEKGSLIGEVVDDKLYLVFSKDGKYVDYKKYI